MSYQLTIQRPVQTSGVGLHTAVPSNLRHFGAADTGISSAASTSNNFEIEADVPTLPAIPESLFVISV